MDRFWIIIYNFVVIHLLWFGFHLLSLFKSKFRTGISGRDRLFEILQSQLQKLDPISKRIWFHASSLGEFEQAKPIIAELKTKFPQVKIIVSFFSPSGYEPSKKYKLADVITYLPFDTSTSAKRFIDIVQPNAAVLIRYDLWPNHLWALKKRNIPVFIANATMRPNTIRRYPILKSFHKCLYNKVGYILTVSEEDLNTFKKFNLQNPKIEVIGDTRYDQVWQKSIESKKKHLLPESILKNKKIFVVGSSWETDEKILFPVFFKLQNLEPDLLMILVPHEPTEHNLERIESELNGETTYRRFSDLHDYSDERVLIVDSIGILMALYQYADVAFVGGAFRSGVHNVLEPAVYGIPVVFGPNYTNSQEAVAFIDKGIGFTSQEDEKMLRILQTLFTDDEYRRDIGRKAIAFVESNIGATQKFLSYFQKVL